MVQQRTQSAIPLYRNHILRKITNGDMTDWDLFLPAVQLALNAKPNVTTGKFTSPASLLFGMNIGDFSNYDLASSSMLSDSELSERATFLNDVLRPESLSVFRRKQKKKAELFFFVCSTGNLIKGQVLLISLYSN